ncbi:MAG TPA: PAS domain S-box protein, partial [Flavobacteriales bacterium]|nr:PAS domain S-box protein [Flavobacteriales bacterium]
MNTHLFDFDFTRVGMVILFIVPALINLLIAGYVYLFLPRGRTNNLFSFFVFLLATWQLFDGFMHLSTSEHSAEAWYRLSRISLQFVMPLGVLFLLRFTRWHKQVSDKIIFSFLLFPAIVFCVIINLRINSYEINPTSAWAWVARPQPTITAFFILFFRGVEAMLMLIIPMAYFMNDQNDEVKRKQAMLLFIAFLVPVCSGFVFEIVLPLVSQYDELPVASSLMTTFSIIALIAIKRYKFLEYSPLHHWENIVDSTSEGILIINGKGQIMYINKALCTLVSYAPREMEGKVAATLFCGSNEKFVEDINKAYNAEMTLKAKFGRKIWVLMNATPYRDVAGNTIGSICILTNITPLKEREASLRQVIDAVRMVTIDIDFAKKAVKLSGNAGEILGLPVEFDNIAGVIDTCVHPDDKYKVRECFSKHEDGTVSDFEFRFIRPDTQQTIWLERRSEAVKDANGKIIGAKGLLIDITAHKMTEEATHTLSERLKEAQAISHVGHWEVDYCKDTTTWSDETYNVLGYTPGGVQSSFKNFLARIHP